MLTLWPHNNLAIITQPSVTVNRLFTLKDHNGCAAGGHTHTHTVSSKSCAYMWLQLLPRLNSMFVALFWLITNLHFYFCHKPLGPPPPSLFAFHRHPLVMTSWTDTVRTVAPPRERHMRTMCNQIFQQRVSWTTLSSRVQRWQLTSNMR